MTLVGRLIERMHIARREGDYSVPIIAAGASLAIIYTVVRVRTALNAQPAQRSSISAARGQKRALSTTGQRAVIPAPSYSDAHPDYPPDLYAGGRRVATPYGHVQIFVEGPTDGPRILLVHGITTPCIVFRGILRSLVQHGYRVATYDLWGRGFTDAPIDVPMDEAAYSFQLLSVLAHLGWMDESSAEDKGTGYTLFGYSLGGGITASFAALYPQGIRNLILVAPAGLLSASEQTPMRKLVQAHWMPFRLVEALQSLVVPKKLEEVKNQVSGDAIDTTETLTWQKDNHKGFSRAYLSSFRSAPIFDREVTFSMIQEHATAGKFKVLAIWGGKDDIVDTQKVSSRLMRTVPAAKLVIVDGIGHNIGTAAPVEVADHVHSFIEGKEDA